MQKSPTFVALYDATPEHGHFESPIHASRARALGRALGQAGLGVIARTSTSIVMPAVLSAAEHGSVAVLLSPAASMHEHANVFRLPNFSVPIIYTGRGAMGADSAALASAKAVIIIGSHPDAIKSLTSILGEYSMPIIVLSDERDPTQVVREVSEKVRQIMRASS